MPIRMSESPVTGDILHYWSVREYHQYERKPQWYMLMIGLGIFLVLFGLFTGNFLFSLIIVLFAIILFLQSHIEPPEIPFQIAELGIIISDRFYTYNELDSFYIIYEPGIVKTLFIETKSPFRPLLRVPLFDQNPVEVRHTLQEFLDEDLTKEEEPIADKIARGWGLH